MTARRDGRRNGAGTDAGEHVSAVECLPVVIARTGRDLRYEWIIDPHADFPPRAAIGRRDDELADGPGIDALVALKRRVLEQGRPARQIITFDVSDGPRTYDVTATPVMDDDSRIVAVATAAQDISGQMATGEPGTDRLAGLVAASEVLPAGFGIAAADGSLTWLDRGALDVLGVATMADAPGSIDAWRDRFPLRTMDSAPLRDEEWPIARALRGDTVRDELVRFRREDGTERYVSFSAAALAAGPDNGAAFVLRDVTPHMLADEEIRQNEARLRALFASIDEGYCLAEILVDGKDRPVDYRFLEVNPRFEEMTGLAGAAGRTARELVPDLEDHWVARYAQVAIDGRTLRFEERSEAMDRWFDVFAAPAGRRRFVLVFKDVTEQHVSAERLETALAVKDEFLGLVSHELKTPLTVIFGLSRILARGSLDADTTHEVAGDLAGAAADLNELVESMLLLARLDSDEPEQLLEPVRVERIAADVLDRHRIRQPVRPYRLDVRATNSIVMVQAGWLDRVMDNLVGNAGKYCDPSVPVDVIIEGDDDEVRVRVLDSGPGIDGADAERLFEAFFRAPSAQRRAGGAGLGLAVVKRIVGLMGGRVWASPRETGGAEFGFSVPLAETDTDAGIAG